MWTTSPPTYTTDDVGDISRKQFGEKNMTFAIMVRLDVVM
jgi:hypothetical protein